ncbi:SET domain-containing protein [Gonapodya prolifera JEL478]|uniref:SET domain-containing protein n=1 Tax=Gonapodya prolifera (strain JEL478) TaxID=1344416 RepID=A0A139ACT6_GONPJ|nr:SET domain-containing protein [Gonapodya prolifera JEL478]|eukprot:KXS14621.1 SET domain-containing protein [Gonapodya prolifera JEL478]
MPVTYPPCSCQAPHTIASKVPPLRVAVTPDKGRCFVAARNIAPGELLLECEAYGGAVIVDSTARKYFCASAECGKFLGRESNGNGEQSETDSEGKGGHSRDCRATLEPLPFGCARGCGTVAYCSKHCSERDWNDFHSYECEFLAKQVLPYCGPHANLVNIPPSPLTNGSTGNGHTPESQNGFKEDKLGALPLTSTLRNPYVHDYLRLLVRVLTARFKELRGQPDDVPVNGHSNTPYSALRSVPCWADVLSMTSNIKEFSEDRVSGEFQVVASKLREYAEHWLGVDQAQLFGEKLDSQDPYLLLVAREECNSFGLYTHSITMPEAERSTEPLATQTQPSSRQSYGLTIYPTAAFFNHSCAPNAVHLSYPQPSNRAGTDSPPATPRMLFFALPRREILAGDEICISYTAPAHLVAAERSQNAAVTRRSELQKWFLFECGCSRCVSEVEGKPLPKEVEAALVGGLCDPKGTVCSGRWVPGRSVDKVQIQCSKEEKLACGDSFGDWRCEACMRPMT